MNIAIIGADKPDSMEFHLADAFIHTGHSAAIFDIYDSVVFKAAKIRPYAQTVDKFLRTGSDSYDKNRFNKVARAVQAYNPDLVICVYKDIHPWFVEAIKTANRKVVHLNPDAMTTLGYQQVFAGNYDAWFTKDPYMYRLMRNNMHLNAYLYTEAFNHRYNARPSMSKRYMECEVGVDVATYGTLYPYRTRMLGEIIRAGINLKLYGVVPHRFFDTTLSANCTGKYIVGDEKARVLYGSKIVLNNLHFAEVESVNCRFFEANGCGAFQLCDYRPILKELLPVDPELVSYKNADEAVEKIRYYLAHPDERYRIADTVYNHFIEHYTYDHLARHILDVVSTL